ncbi:hypothetical protein ABDK00_006755 [Niabella insulamsoli]|uniref:hypothetical protein n=1 Tax=Niabella insulamsoli TaxID=3144874 RepID=UPI0031FD541F
MRELKITAIKALIKGDSERFKAIYTDIERERLSSQINLNKTPGNALQAMFENNEDWSLSDDTLYFGNKKLIADDIKTLSDYCLHCLIQKFESCKIQDSKK